MRERLAGDALAQLAGAVVLAMAMNLVGQPRLQPAEVAGTEIGVEFASAQIESGTRHKLCRVKIAQRVSGEVTHAAEAPVDVLQETLGVVCRHQTEHLLEALVPNLRHVGRLQLAAD